jgi:hypothetical protein
MTGNRDTSLTIDTHRHILPKFFWQETENVRAPVGGLAPLRWSKEAASRSWITLIDVAVVSLSTPGVHTGDSAKARGLARRCNEFSAELARSRPDLVDGVSRKSSGFRASESRRYKSTLLGIMGYGQIGRS